MKFVCLVPRKLCKTEIAITLYEEGLTEDGAPKELTTIETKCNYQDSAKTILTTQQKLIQITGKAIIPGDIYPELPTISGGKAVVNGVEREIFQGIKARNPDGTVNYTELRLI